MLTNLVAFFKAKKPVTPVTPVVVPPPTPVVAPTTYSAPITVAIVNQCTVLTDAQVTPVVAALQVQVSRDVAPAWGIDAHVIQVMKGQVAPKGVWQLVLLDNADQAGALGYHDLTSDGLPIGKAFMKTDLDNGAIWSVTVSHELLEMLVDPWINLTVFSQTTNTAGKLYAYEVCDACEADNLAYDINGVKVSDFVHPSWFSDPGSKDKMDQMGKITKSFQVLAGGYIGEFDVTRGGGWKQLTAQRLPDSSHRASGASVPGTRRERRARGHQHWKRSTI